MRILYISCMGTSPWGGSEELWSQSAVRLLEAGHCVAACVHGWRNLHPKLVALESSGATIFQRPSAFPVQHRILWKLSSRRNENPVDLIVERWILEFKPDLVCINQGGCADGLRWMELCARCGVPYVSLGQSNADWEWHEDGERVRLIEAFTKARASFFVSQGNLKLFQHQLAHTLPHAKIVRNPFNVPFDATLPWPSEEDGFRLACVGRLDPGGKGQDLLLQVLARPEWRERDLKVRFYGGGRCEEGVKALAKMLSVGNVEFVGEVSEIQNIWRHNHGLVLPSRCEGLPLSLVEAMLCARPAIVTDVAGNAEIVEDGVTGFVAQAPTTELLAQAMDRAWLARSHWSSMGKTAATRVRNIFPPDPDKVFAELLLRLGNESGGLLK